MNFSLRPYDNPDLMIWPCSEAHLANFVVIQTHFSRHFHLAVDFLEVIYDGIEITGCWANINAVRGSHSEHTHPNNYLSGVYCVQADPGADTFTIKDSRSQRSMIRARVKQSTVHNAGEHKLTVQPGDMILFPAWLPYSVDPNDSQRERISISFNIMFDDFMKIMGPPEWHGSISTGGSA